MASCGSLPPAVFVARWIAQSGQLPIGDPLGVQKGKAMALLLKNVLFTMIVPGTVGVYVPVLLARGRPVASGFALAVAIAILALGAAIYAWTVWDFATFGRGTPAPIDAPKKLVVRGLYEYTRNPMYVGVLTVICGWAAIFQDPRLLLYAFIVGSCFHLFIVLYEERHLAGEFGSQYETYRGQVPRWLLRAPRASAAPRLRREWKHGLRCLWRFVTTPSDLANSFEAMFALAGPTLEKEFGKFASTPLGREMLGERPRRDLNALLTDHGRLQAMPTGSFAAAYLRYLGDDDMGSAEYFFAAAGLDEKARRFGWSEDQLWFVKRMANSHDLFHVVGGYGRDVIGEVGILGFTAGQIPLLPLRLLLPYFLLLNPSHPLRWARFIRDSYRHGRDTPSLACVDYEALLPLPLAEARQAMGVRPVEDAHTRGLPEKGWLLDRVERNVMLA